jgi:hypothetical protein
LNAAAASGTVAIYEASTLSVVMLYKFELWRLWWHFPTFYSFDHRSLTWRVGIGREQEGATIDQRPSKMLIRNDVLPVNGDAIYESCCIIVFPLLKLLTSRKSAMRKWLHQHKSPNLIFVRFFMLHRARFCHETSLRAAKMETSIVRKFSFLLQDFWPSFAHESFAFKHFLSPLERAKMLTRVRDTTVVDGLITYTSYIQPSTGNKFVSENCSFRDQVLCWNFLDLSSAISVGLSRRFQFRGNNRGVEWGVGGLFRPASSLPSPSGLTL